jgi:hypothetical protein
MIGVTEVAIRLIGAFAMSVTTDPNEPWPSRHLLNAAICVGEAEHREHIGQRALGAQRDDLAVAVLAEEQVKLRLLQFVELVFVVGEQQVVPQVEQAVENAHAGIEANRRAGRDRRTEQPSGGDAAPLAGRVGVSRQPPVAPAVNSIHDQNGMR